MDRLDRDMKICIVTCVLELFCSLSSIPSLVQGTTMSEYTSCRLECMECEAPTMASDLENRHREMHFGSRAEQSKCHEGKRYLLSPHPNTSKPIRANPLHQIPSFSPLLFSSSFQQTRPHISACNSAILSQSSTANCCLALSCNNSNFGCPSNEPMKYMYPFTGLSPVTVPNLRPFWMGVLRITR